jgi:hypothetical protein
MILLLEMSFSFRNIQWSIDDNEEPLISVSSLPVTLPVQSLSQPQIKPLISSQTHIYKRLPKSTFLRANPEKPLPARAKSAKRTSFTTVIHAYVFSFSFIMSSSGDSLSISPKSEH